MQGPDFKQHTLIEINSKTRDNGVIENFVTRLSHQIKFSQSAAKRYYMRLEDILIPKSYYDIDETNNRFSVLEYDAGNVNTLDDTAIIPPGNYTIGELLIEVETQLDANTNYSNVYSLIYDEVTSKIDMSYVGTSARVVVHSIGFAGSPSTLSGPLGFGRTDLLDDNMHILPGVTKTTPYAVDLDTKSYIVVETDVTSNNFYDKDSQKHIGAFVPMTVDRNERQTYYNHDGAFVLMNSKGPLSQIQLRLLDEYKNQIDLNGVNYSVTISIMEYTDNTKL